MRQEEATSGCSCCPIIPDHHPVVGDAWVWRWGGAPGSTGSEFREIQRDRLIYYCFYY